jgi:hypothetical protein
MPSTLKLKIKIDSDETFKTWLKIKMKQRCMVVYKVSSSHLALAVSWQSEGLARPSVVLPLHAGLFISCVSRQNRQLAGFPSKLGINSITSLAPHTSGPRDVPRCGALVTFGNFWLTIQNTANWHVSNAFDLLSVFISFPLAPAAVAVAAGTRCCCCCW